MYLTHGQIKIKLSSTIYHAFIYKCLSKFRCQVKIIWKMIFAIGRWKPLRFNGTTIFLCVVVDDLLPLCLSTIKCCLHSKTKDLKRNLLLIMPRDIWTFLLWFYRRERGRICISQNGIPRSKLSRYYLPKTDSIRRSYESYSFIGIHMKSVRSYVKRIS